MLVKAIRDLEDEALLDSTPAIASERPAGLLYGLTSVGVGSPADIASDLAELWRAVRGGEPEAPAFICAPRAAVYLATLTAADGGLLFPNAGPLGGTIWNVPLIVSRAAQDFLILIDAGALLVHDDGLTIERSNQTAIQLTTTPSSGPTNLVSGFQTNTRFIKITRFLNWKLGYSDAIALLTLPIGSPN